MAPGSIVQAAFGGGVFRALNAPGDTVYDAINALISDDRKMFRRGGSTYRSGSNADGTLLGLWDGHTVAGQRTFFWSATSPYVLDSNDSSILDLGSVVPEPLSSGVEVGGVVFFRGGLVSSYETEVVYAGSRKTANYTTGTMTTTAGSATVTGVGTTWTTNVDPGMILLSDDVVDGFIGVVKSVESNTSLTLAKPTTAALAGVAYILTPIARFSLVSTGGTQHLLKSPTTAFHAVAGQRLIRTRDNRAYFSLPASHDNFLKASGVAYPGAFEESLADSGVGAIDEDFHELPRAALIIGADSIEDTAILFTTSGTWAISNMALDPFDDVGNVQHQVSQISQDLILWGEAGIAAYEGALIVPAIDDVLAFALGAAPVPLSQGIRPLYREYVEAGYKPGLASAYRGHYFLPILDASNNVIDSLTCRLDLRDTDGSRRPAWTRQANGAAGRAYATRVGATARTPKLLGLDGLRVSDLTGCFDPDATRKDDADGTDHALTVTSNDLDTGPGLRGNTVLSANAEYELVDAASDNPTVAFATATGAEGSSFTTHTALATGASTGPESDGTVPVAFDVRRKVERVRWRFQTSGAATSAILRRVELKVRPSGRQ